MTKDDIIKQINLLVEYQSRLIKYTSWPLKILFFSLPFILFFDFFPEFKNLIVLVISSIILTIGGTVVLLVYRDRVKNGITCPVCLERINLSSIDEVLDTSKCVKCGRIIIEN